MVSASVDYVPEQIAAWSRRGQQSLSEWDQAMRRRNSFVALVADQIVGFSDVSEAGYIDMMYVSPRFSRRGVGRELLTFLEKQARGSAAKRLLANVSMTARPFFETAGFEVAAEQHPVVNGVVMTNFRLRKELEPPAPARS